MLFIFSSNIFEWALGLLLIMWKCASYNNKQMLSWPESRLQVPGVAHELPPVHRGVVDAVVLVFIRGAFIVQGGGALLAGPRCEHPRGKKSWEHRGREAIRSLLWNAPVFSFSTFVNNNIRAQHRCVLLQLFRMNQTCENLKRSQCYSFYFAAESTEQSHGCFNCGDESEVAGIKSANLFLCDDLKPIRMLRASGSLTWLLCVKVTACHAAPKNLSHSTRTASQVQRQTDVLNLVVFSSDGLMTHILDKLYNAWNSGGCFFRD